MYSRAFLGNMTGNLQADGVQSRQAGFVRCCLNCPDNTKDTMLLHSAFLPLDYKIFMRFPDTSDADGTDPDRLLLRPCLHLHNRKPLLSEWLHPAGTFAAEQRLQQ